MTKEKTTLKQKNKIHFIGIGGIGTSALARWFLSYGFSVSGSDISDSPLIQELKRQGIKIYKGHKASNVSKDVKSVVYSEAIPKNNTEIQKAIKLGLPVKSAAEVLGELSKKYKTICVSGAHGKGTTTALLSLILIRAGFDPSVIIGTKLKQFGNENFRQGKSDWLILESDEYQKKLLNYSPYAAVITNIDREHLDCYKNLADIKNTFLRFIANIQPGGILIVNKNDKNTLSLKNKIKKIAQKNNLRVYWYGLEHKLDKFLKIPGQHILSDASAASSLAKALGIKDKFIVDGINGYNGAWRRMEYRGKLHISHSTFNIPLYDDYAHHPAEIRATLAGIAQKWPKTALICVFQPHQAKRLTLLFNDFKRAFSDADSMVILDIFRPIGRDKVSHNMSCCNENKFRRKTPARFCNAINIIAKSRSSAELAKAIPGAVYLPRSKQNQLKKILEKIIYDSCSTLHDSWIVVMMGAGDIYKLTDKLVK